MSKFICVKTETDSVPLGTVVEGSISKLETIIVSKDSEVKSVTGSPLIKKGTHMPLKGNLWEWQEDVLDVLDRFEKAVRQQEQYNSDIHHYGESDIDISDDVINSRCETAKADLLKALGK